jgi:hypothetical protein
MTMCRPHAAYGTVNTGCQRCPTDRIVPPTGIRPPRDLRAAGDSPTRKRIVMITLSNQSGPATPAPSHPLRPPLTPLAGLRLRDRWGGWTGEPYTSTSWRHMSVYEHS